jgi:hypothetical protein
MATKIAEYKFNRYENWAAAKNRLYDKLGSTNYSNSITEQSSGSSYWISIWDNCDDAKAAGQICEGNCGEIYYG